jgi:hypothetical protein
MSLEQVRSLSVRSWSWKSAVDGWCELVCRTLMVRGCRSISGGFLIHPVGRMAKLEPQHQLALTSKERSVTTVTLVKGYVTVAICLTVQNTNELVQSQLAGVHSISMKCERVGNSNMCAPCAKMGRPCSWTGLPFLFGVQDWHDEVYVKRATKGTVHQEAVKGLLCFPRNEDALQVHTIGQDPGFVAMGDVDNAKHVPIQFHQLTPAEQQAFNSWLNQVDTLIGRIMKLKVGTTEYNAGMGELQTLADSVTTANVSPRLYAYMSRRVQQDIMYFMINGRPYIRGG